MLLPFVYLQAWLVSARPGRPGHPPSSDDRLHGEAGQTTAEYALVLIGAAALAVLVITWTTKTNLVGKLFDVVLERVTGRAT